MLLNKLHNETKNTKTFTMHRLVLILKLLAFHEHESNIFLHVIFKLIYDTFKICVCNVDDISSSVLILVLVHHDYCPLQQLIHITLAASLHSNTICTKLVSHVTMVTKLPNVDSNHSITNQGANYHNQNTDT